MEIYIETKQTKTHDCFSTEQKINNQNNGQNGVWPMQKVNMEQLEKNRENILKSKNTVLSVILTKYVIIFL